MADSVSLWEKILRAITDANREDNLYKYEDVTLFLGIPVDGSPRDMIGRIKKKGFVNTKFADKKILSGRYNGTEVYVDIQTKTDRVSRVVVFDADPLDADAVRIRYNDLCDRFANDPDYISLSDYRLPDSEDIASGMAADDEKYQVSFYQIPRGGRVGWHTVAEMTLKRLSGDLAGLSEEELRLEFDKIYAVNQLKAMMKKVVWLTIVQENRNSFRTAVFYENGSDGNDKDV